MKRTIALALWMAALLVAQEGATVEGTVTNTATHAGLPGVKVTLWTQQAVHYDTTTDDSGSWRITGIKPGRYFSRFEKAGFTDPPQEGLLNLPALPIGAGGTPIHLDGALAPLAILRGRVFDPDGKPAPRVDVGLSQYHLVETAEDGTFELTDVRPGSYTLQAKPKPASEKPPKEGQTEIVSTYFPSVVDRAQANPITVHAGDELSGFEIRLRAEPVYHLRGVVLDKDGKPLPKATVTLRSPSSEQVFGGQMVFGSVRYFFGGPSRQTQEASVESRPDGSFEFPAVVPGDWHLRAETDPTHGPRQNLIFSWSLDLPAPVTDHSLDGLEIRFPETLTVQAAFDFGDHPLPSSSGRGGDGLLLIAPVEGISVNLPPAHAESDGKMTFENVPEGRYRVTPIPGFPAGYYPAAVMLGTQDILGQPVDLVPGMPPVRVVYKPGAGTVRGTVADGSSALVLLWPQNASMLDLTRAVQAAATGAFEIPSLSPGDYHVLAVDAKNLTAVPETVLRSVAVNATGAHVEENSTVTVNLPLTHVPE